MSQIDTTEQMWNYLHEVHQHLKSGIASKEEQVNFVRYYRELNSIKPLPGYLRSYLPQILQDHPELLYKGSGIMTPEEFLTDYIRLENDPNVYFSKLTIAMANCNLFANTLKEAYTNQVNHLDQTNWFPVASEIESKAKQCGWNGVYDDDDTVARDKANSALMQALHKHAPDFLNATDNLDNIKSVCCTMVSVEIDQFLSNHPDTPNYTALGALCAVLNRDEFGAKYVNCEIETSDLGQAYTTIISSFIENACYKDITAWLIWAGLMTSVEEELPLANIYTALVNCLALEKQGISQCTGSDDLLFTLLGAFTGFESWHDKTYGGHISDQERSASSQSTPEPEPEPAPTHRRSVQMPPLTPEEKANQEAALRTRRRMDGVCQNCGGSFRGIFRKTCAICGKRKDY